MAIAKVQGPFYRGASADTVTTPFTNTPTEGNLLIAIISTYASGTDGADGVTGFTYCIRVAHGGTSYLAIYYKIAGASESKDVVGTWTASTALKMIVSEYSGIASAVLDKTAITAHTGSTVTSRSSGTTDTITANVELCIAAFATGNTTTSQSFSNSFTDEYSNDTNLIYQASLATSSAAAQETTMTWTTARYAGGCIATFMAAPAAAGNPYYAFAQQQ
jgi:hypothetical protein